MNHIKKVTLFLFSVLVIVLGLFTQTFAATRVHGYTTRRGTYVHSYYRSDSDYTRLNNYSHMGNINPYTGKKGYKK